MEPSLDSSFADLVAYKDALLEWGAFGVATAVVVFAIADARTRARWMAVARVAREDGPYRSSDQTLRVAARAPRLVRAAAFGCFVFGHLFVPGLVFTLTRFRFDGIGVSLIPGVGVAAVIWLCGWLLLSGSALAREASRVTAIGSLALHVALLAMSFVHLATIEAESPLGMRHVCSSSVAFIAFFYAFAAILQSVLILRALGARALPLAASAAPLGPTNVQANDRGPWSIAPPGANR